MSDEQVRDEVLTIFLAGYETVANALTWTWYLLSQNPEVEANSTPNSTPSSAPAPTPPPPHPRRLPRPPLHRASLRRIHAPLPARLGDGPHVHQTRHLGPYRIPSGAHFFFSQYIMGRDPQYFPDPLRFDPDRFTPENKAARPKFTYFPFGGGNRQCIGESFAWMEGVLSIATIAQRWRMTYLGATPPEVQAKITLRPKDPLMMQLEPRS